VVRDAAPETSTTVRGCSHIVYPVVASSGRDGPELGAAAGYVRHVNPAHSGFPPHAALGAA
jgi:hypothetical protein